MMRAIGYQKALPVDHPESLQDIDVPRPAPGERDLLVRIKAVSVNPVDTKVRFSLMSEAGQWRILGYDAAGVVEEIGPEVTAYSVGDEVFYSGTLHRPGTNAEYHLVDERLVGQKPRSLNWAEAASLPLTAVTAWEMLFDRLDIRRSIPGASSSILIIGGGGGVSSVAIQLVRVLTDLTVIATASRPETHDWVRGLGAHYVLDHSKPLASQWKRLSIGAPGLVFSTTQTKQHYADIIELIAPQGRLGLIDDPDELSALPLKQKSLSLHWELMDTRPFFNTVDMMQQGQVLHEISRLVDEERLRTTLGQICGTINADNLRRAHALIERGQARGKIVLEGFSS